jgi:dihydroorotase
MERLTILRPDDWHLHLRDGAALAAVVADSARRFARAIVMPNLVPPIRTTRAALAYRERILSALPPRARFDPLMTLYLTDDTPPEEITTAKESGRVHAVKLYPAGATTHSAAGVTRISRCFHALERMAQVDLPLLVHGEVTDPAIDVFDRRARSSKSAGAARRALSRRCRVVLEHITTREAAQFVEVTGPEHRRDDHRASPDHEPQFAFPRRRAPAPLLPAGLKREEHREALVAAATSGNPKFFLGTDSAPHARSAKEAACGCAGMYTAHAAIELYAVAFEEAGKLDKLEGFASRFGPQFYGLQPNRDRITLVRSDWQVPAALPFGPGAELIPLRAGETIPWKLV